jgi:hypothetical protein
MRFLSWTRQMLPVAVCGLAALVAATPAHAGRYAIASVSGGGSATITYADGSTQTTTLDPYWPGFEGEVLWGPGSITYNFSATYTFAWVPDDGYSDEEDPPVATTGWVSLDGLMEDLGNSGQAYIPGGANGTMDLTVNGTTQNWSASMSSTPYPEGHPNYPGCSTTRSGDWGAIAGGLPYNLSGDSPMVSIQSNGSLSGTGPVGVRMAQNPRPPYDPNDEWIIHKTPNRNNRPLRLGNAFTRNGLWKGNVNRKYKIKHTCADPLGNHDALIPPGFVYPAGEAGPWNAGTNARAWTGGPHLGDDVPDFTPNTVGRWTSYVELFHWDYTLEDYVWTGKSSHAGHDVHQ